MVVRLSRPNTETEKASNMNRAVLLVDDENLLSNLVQALHGQPFQVYTAHNGDEAMRLLKMRHFDAVVTDERTPGASGLRLLKWVAQNCPDVVRIVLTAQAEAEAPGRVIGDARACRFFPKPGSEAQLAVVIRQLLDRKALEERRRTEVPKPRLLPEPKSQRGDAALQTPVTARDLQRPIEQVLYCCGRLEEHSGARLDSASHTLLDDARKAAAEARRLVLQLQAAVITRTPPRPAAK
jgi:two-component system, probable response regulator PhcQ